MLSFILIDLPVPTITLPPSMVVTAGQPLSLTCNVTVVEHLVVDPVVEWVVSTGDTPPAGDTVTSGVVSTRTVSYDSLLTSHGGRYMCRASISISGMNVAQNEDSIDITIQSKYRMMCHVTRHVMLHPSAPPSPSSSVEYRVTG